MTNEIFNGYEPQKHQLPFHDSQLKFRALIGGIGSGKTAAGANELIKNAIAYPKCKHLILAPTAKVMQYATLEQFFKFCPKEIIMAHIKSKNMILLKNGAQIIYLTGDNERHIDRLRGIEIGSFWIDEGRLFPKNIWDITLGRLRAKNAPLKGWVTTTPNGFDYLYWYFVKKTHPKNKKLLNNPHDYGYFMGSTFDNPFTPEEYKQNLRSQLAGKFARQELYGDFVGFEGQVYDNFRHSIHIHKIPETRKFKKIIAGADFGFTNPTAALIVGLDNDDRVYVLKEYYRKRQDVDDLINWLKFQQDNFCGKISAIYADPSEPNFIMRMNSAGLQTIPANNEIIPGITTVYSLFEVREDGFPRLFINESCQNLIDELNSYRYAEEKESKESKELPIKVNDHACDSLKYLCHSYFRDRKEYKLLDMQGLL